MAEIIHNGKQMIMHDGDNHAIMSPEGEYHGENFTFMKITRGTSSAYFQFTDDDLKALIIHAQECLISNAAERAVLEERRRLAAIKEKK